MLSQQILETHHPYGIFTPKLSDISFDKIIHTIFDDYLRTKNHWTSKTKICKRNTLKRLDFSSTQNFMESLEEDKERLRPSSYNVRIALCRNLAEAFDMFAEECPDQYRITTQLERYRPILLRLQYLKHASNRHHRPFTRKQIYDIMDLLKQGNNQWLYYSFWLALYTGLRVKEIERLDLKDIDFVRNTVYVEKGKGMKSREVAVYSLQVLEEWLEIRQKILTRKGDPDDQALFINTRGTRPKICSGDFRTINQYLDYHVHWHRTRATFAKRMYEASRYNILLLRDLLGHANIATTQEYLGAIEDATGLVQMIGDIYDMSE